MSPKVSVIVPVYNTEKYLNQCIESLINQTLKEIELIFVDDGSTDGSIRILESYKEKDSRIKILHQKNLHAGVARNTGMKIATGKYLIFLDSDDYFETDMLEKIYYTGEKNNAQIVLFEYLLFDDVTQTMSYEFNNKILSPGMVKCSHRSELYEISGSVAWNKLYLRSFIVDNKLQFQNLVNANDAFFVYMALFLADRVYYLNKNFVYYRIHNSKSLQGNVEKDLTCPFQYLIALRSEVNSSRIIDSNVDQYLKKKLDDEIYHSFYSGNSTESVRKGFEYAKSHIVPDFYPDMDSVPIGSRALQLIESETFESFLLNEVVIEKKKIEDMEKNYIPKKSLDYCLGHLLLTIPRKLKKIMYSKRY